MAEPKDDDAKDGAQGDDLGDDLGDDQGEATAPLTSARPPAPDKPEPAPESSSGLSPEPEPEPGDDGPELDRTIIDDRAAYLPPAVPPAWSGRAGVPEPPTEILRGGVPHPRQPEPEPSRTWWTPVLLGLLALGLVGIVVLAAWLIGRDAGTEPGPTTPATAPTATAPTAPTVAASPTPSPSAQMVQIPPDLVGLAQGDATAALDALGLSYRLEFAPSNEPEGIVIQSDPAPGELVPVPSSVRLVISLGPAQTPGPQPSTTP